MLQCVVQPFALITREAFEEQKNQNIGKRSAVPRLLLLSPGSGSR